MDEGYGEGNSMEDVEYSGTGAGQDFWEVEEQDEAPFLFDSGVQVSY